MYKFHIRGVYSAIIHLQKYLLSLPFKREWATNHESVIDHWPTTTMIEFSTYAAILLSKQNKMDLMVFSVDRTSSALKRFSLTSNLKM